MKCVLALALPLLAAAQAPTIFLIGDATVRSGHGPASINQWGWGEKLTDFIDSGKANLVNLAGGTSNRNFYNSAEWQKTLATIKPGDFLIVQFGHNDNLGDPAWATKAATWSFESRSPVKSAVVMPPLRSRGRHYFIYGKAPKTLWMWLQLTFQRSWSRELVISREASVAEPATAAQPIVTGSTLSLHDRAVTIDVCARCIGCGLSPASTRRPRAPHAFCVRRADRCAATIRDRHPVGRPHQPGRRAPAPIRRARRSGAMVA